MKEDLFIRDESMLSDELPDDLLEEIDLALGEAISGVREDKSPELELDPEEFQFISDETFLAETDYGTFEMQKTFLEMAKQVLAPLGRYIKAFVQGEDYWLTLEVSEMMVSPLVSQLEQVELTEHYEKLSFFRALLLLAKGERDPQGQKVMKNVLKKSSKEIEKFFQLKSRGSRVAVKNLLGFYRLLKYSDVLTDLDVRRFFAVGIPSLTWLKKTHDQELASLSGISMEKIAVIRDLTKEYMVSLKEARLIRSDQLAAAIPQNHSSESSRSVMIDRDFILDPGYAFNVDPLKSSES
ncbi:MAG: hypothetical protein KDD52_03565 [Bdellovibrionales bacterium]|nr:hypothetical protein [Bdellovibrionales bacterium]